MPTFELKHETSTHSWKDWPSSHRRRRFSAWGKPSWKMTSPMVEWPG